MISDFFLYNFFLKLYGNLGFNIKWKAFSGMGCFSVTFSIRKWIFFRWESWEKSFYRSYECFLGSLFDEGGRIELLCNCKWTGNPKCSNCLASLSLKYNLPQSIPQMYLNLPFSYLFHFVSSAILYSKCRFKVHKQFYGFTFFEKSIWYTI